MARTKLTNTTNDLISDSGSVLFSFVQGEQLEYPVILNFAQVPLSNYTFEAVVIEAMNISDQIERPTSVRLGGVQTKLTVRVPQFTGSWNSANPYTIEELCLYNGLYYRLVSGINRISATTPDLDSYWVEVDPKQIYIQFPLTLGGTWLVKPAVGYPAYGFFELRVTEPNNSVLQRTWKPVRGMLELHFSPTEAVPDTP